LLSLVVPSYAYDYLHLDSDYLYLIIVYSILSTAYMFFQSITIGYGEIMFYNIVELFLRCTSIFLILGLYFIGGATVENAFITTIIGIALSLMFYVSIFIFKLNISIKCSFNEFKKHLPYTAKSYFGSISSFLLQRMDILVLGGLVNVESVGFYSVAISVTMMIEGVSGAISQLLLPKLIDIKILVEKHVFFKKIIAVNLLIFSLICFIVMIFSDQIISTLFGSRYKESASLLIFLLPGVFFRSFTNLFGALIGSINIPRSGALFGLLMCLITYWMITSLVPVYGIGGAAITYSIVSFLFVPYVIYYGYIIFYCDKKYIW